MIIIRSVIQEELKRNLQMQTDYRRMLAALPRGSITTKIVKGYLYFYWVYRENGKVVNKYIHIHDADIGDLMLKVRKRRSVQQMLRDLQKSQRELERLLRLTGDD